ncbi:MAG: hypothetical protein SH807_10670 [Blastochloris sp.]|jgi:D-alanyl-lipoteichoic acid acyltransferase DltB (MBOAT superfamily)|nr:hypothetical protein [Blastochloris sp.]
MFSLRPLDLFKLLGYFLLHALLLTPIFVVFWLLKETEKLEVSILLSLAGIAALLVLAQRQKHFTLVLGLCSLAFWFQMEPFLGLYLLAVSAVLYTVLHLTFKAQRILFWCLLVGFILVVPKLLPWIFAAKPVLWLWLRESLLLGFFLRYWMWERECRNPKIAEQRFFEHLSYIFFIPQLLKLIPVTPSLHFGQTQDYPKTLKPAAQIFLLGSVKLLLFQLHLLLPLGLQAGGAHWFGAAWYQILTSYVLWYLWLSAHCDYAVSIARLLGIQVPSLFHFPLLARTPQEFWKRWLTLYHQFLRAHVYLPLGGRASAIWSVPLTFFISALLFGGLWVGSSLWIPPHSFWLQWLPFFMLQALFVTITIKLHSKIRSLSLWQQILGTLFTQFSLAASCLFLTGLSRFPGDTLSLGQAWQIFRVALFLD